MTNILRISRYYQTYAFKWYSLGVAALLLIHLIASLLVDKLVAPDREAGIAAPLVILAGFALGGLFFPGSFTYLVQQGISRFRFFVSTLLNLVVISVIFALLMVIYYVLMTATVYSIGSITIYEAMYHNQSIIGMLIWDSSALFMMAVAGWLVSVVSYRSNLKARIASYLGVVVLVILAGSLNSLFGLKMWQNLAEFLQNALGLASSPANPYLGSLSFSGLALILLVPVYLLLRRAPVKN